MQGFLFLNLNKLTVKIITLIIFLFIGNNINANSLHLNNICIVQAETPTGLTINGNPIYKGIKGGYYYYSINKNTGQKYKRYLTQAQRIKLGLN